MTQTPRLYTPEPSPTPLSLRERFVLGARYGFKGTVYFLIVFWLVDRLPPRRDLNFHVKPKGVFLTDARVPWIPAFLVGCMLAGALMKVLEPLVDSVHAEMLLVMLALVPMLLGTGLLLFGWRLSALDPLVITIPLGAFVGFLRWRHLSRVTREVHSTQSTM